MTEEEIVEDVLSNLKIENPCPMLIGRMKGEKPDQYYCNSCEKTIVDFRDLSDEEVVAKLQEGRSCGIFYEDQLQGQDQVRRYNWMEKAAFYALMFFSWVGVNVAPLQAQVRIPKLEKDNIQAKKKEPLDKGVDLKDAVKIVVKEKALVEKKKKRPRRRRFVWRKRITGCPKF